MTNEELLTLSQGIKNISELKGQKFGYIIARNVKLLSPELKKFDDARIALAESYSKKLDNKPVMKDNQYDIENKEGFDQEYKKLLQEKVEVNLFKLDLADVPEEITSGQMVGITLLIKELT